jgi:DNA-binding MarR family transcriptional regulator
MVSNARIPLLQRGIVDFFITHDLLRMRIEKAMRPLALNLTHMSLLNHFASRPQEALTVTHLANVMSINQPGITKAVGALVDKGCLEKVDSREDARVKHLKITKAGLMLLDQARGACFPAVEQAFSSLDDNLLAEFTMTLSSLKSHLNTSSKT